MVGESSSSSVLTSAGRSRLDNRRTWASRSGLRSRSRSRRWLPQARAGRRRNRPGTSCVSPPRRGSFPRTHPRFTTTSSAAPADRRSPCRRGARPGRPPSSGEGTADGEGRDRAGSRPHSRRARRRGNLELPRPVPAGRLSVVPGQRAGRTEPPVRVDAVSRPRRHGRSLRRHLRQPRRAGLVVPGCRHADRRQAPARPPDRVRDVQRRRSRIPGAAPRRHARLARSLARPAISTITSSRRRARATTSTSCTNRSTTSTSHRSAARPTPPCSRGGSRRSRPETESSSGRGRPTATSTRANRSACGEADRRRADQGRERRASVRRVPRELGLDQRQPRRRVDALRERDLRHRQEDRGPPLEARRHTDRQEPHRHRRPAPHVTVQRPARRPYPRRRHGLAVRRPELHRPASRGAVQDRHERRQRRALSSSLSDPTINTSSCCGSARVLSDGNWLVSWGGENPTSASSAPTGRGSCGSSSAGCSPTARSRSR